MSRALECRDKDGVLIGYLVRCPACDADDRGHAHLFQLRMGDGGPGWTFNGNFERPTFRPSMLASARYGEDHVRHICHSFVTDGRIQYLSDCTHAMAGQTVDLPPFD